MEIERLNVSEAFVKSKRNLLWICTLIIFIYFANLPNNVDIKIAEVQFSISRYYFMIMTTMYFIYLLLSYLEELYFLYRQNSEAGRTLEALNAKDFVEGSISEISNSIDLMKQSITNIENLNSNLPSGEPVTIEAMQFSSMSLDELRNTMTLAVDEARQKIQKLTHDLIQTHGQTDEILRFNSEATREFHITAQKFVNNFLTVKLELLKVHKSSDLIENQKRFDDRMNLLNNDLLQIKSKIENDAILIKKSAQSFLGISNSVHRVSKTSFLVLSSLVPALLSLASALILFYYLFCSS